MQLFWAGRTRCAVYCVFARNGGIHVFTKVVESSYLGYRFMADLTSANVSLAIALALWAPSERISSTAPASRSARRARTGRKNSFVFSASSDLQSTQPSAPERQFSSIHGTRDS